MFWPTVRAFVLVVLLWFGANRTSMRICNSRLFPGMPETAQTPPSPQPVPRQVSRANSHLRRVIIAATAVTTPSWELWKRSAPGSEHLSSWCRSRNHPGAQSGCSSDSESAQLKDRQHHRPFPGPALLLDPWDKVLAHVSNRRSVLALAWEAGPSELPVSCPGPEGTGPGEEWPFLTPCTL